ncbi:hypothetical protein J3Q64DRAFT_1128099 [Phycomyces blakesleeanus]|uniref:Uncharacterized protein n=1 Tax=Phycomyces blakesleeanus TaxID=4837 RepID=A0ABR3AYX4_PHYBL
MNSNNEELTHPLLYRDSVNHPNPCCNKAKSPSKSPDEIIEPRPAKAEDKDNWDLYPNMIREVENKGTPEQVERLHELEHKHN